MDSFDGEKESRSRSGSSYSHLSETFEAGTSGFREGHQLFELNDLDIIDPEVLKDNIFFTHDDEQGINIPKKIDWDKLRENLLYYHRIPGRVKIDKAWQVCGLLGWDKALGNVYYELPENEKVDAAGQNPLHFLALNGEVIKLQNLLGTKGCDLKQEDFEPKLDKDNPEAKGGFTNTGCSAMGYALIAGQKDMVAFLREKGLFPEEFHDNRGNCALHYLAMGEQDGMMKDYEDKTIVVDGNVEENPNCKYDIQRANDEGCEPTHLLMLNGHVKGFEAFVKRFSLQALIDNGPTETTGMNFCHLAAASGSVEAVEYALKTFDKKMQREADANGAHMGLLAVRSGSRDVIVLLGQHLHGIDSVDKRGYGALEYAVAYGKPHLVQWLRSQGITPKKNLMQVAVEHGQLFSIKELLRMYPKSKTIKVDLFQRIEILDGKIKLELFPIQFAKEDHTRRYLATLMVDKLLELKKPHETKHKLAEWKGNVKDTLQVYLSKTSTKNHSWIPKEQVEAFIDKVKHFDNGADNDKMLEAIREEMIKTVVIRAQRDHERQTAASRKFHSDFIGEYLRYLHACYQHLNPTIILLDEDKIAPTTKEVASAALGEVKKAFNEKVEAVGKDFQEKHPDAYKKWQAFTAKFQKKGDDSDQVQEKQEEKVGEGVSEENAF